MALVAGVFSACVAVLLVINFVRGDSVKPFFLPEIVAQRQQEARPPLAIQMAQLKAWLAKDTSNEALKTEIRATDLRMRQEFFRRQAYARFGIVLLLGGLGLCLLCAKVARHLAEAPPLPPTEPPDLRAEAARGGVAVTLTGILLCGMLAALALTGRQDVALRYTAEVKPPAKAKIPSAAEIAKQWPIFRGPGGLGIAAGNYPTTWDGAKGTHIRWKTPLTLPGQNSPVVWGNAVFLSGADEHQRKVFCLDADTGKLRWTGAVEDISCADHTPLEVMEDTGYAAPTMAVDGTHACAMFANGDVACFDFAGKRLWALNLGKPDSMYGHAASLTIYRDRLIVQFDQGTSEEDGKSALLALDLATGATLWKVKRAVPNSWTTPIIISAGRREELITSANPWVIAYNPQTGEELWRASCMSGDVAPSPVFNGTHVIAANTGAGVFAIPPGGSGDVTKTIAWKSEDDLPDTCSPLATKDLVIVVDPSGMVACYDAHKGGKLWEHQFDMPFRASPTLVGKTFYLPDQDGVTHLIAADKTFKEIGTAPLGEGTNCSPAFVNGRIYLRGTQNLYCIEGK